jgi:hypothetical protein
MNPLIKTTVAIPAVELTKEQEHELWNMSPEEQKSVHGIQHWSLSDGRNDILFVGEDFYRVVVRPKK